MSGAWVDARDLAAAFGIETVAQRLGPYLGVDPVRIRAFDAAIALGLDLPKLNRALVEQRLRQLAAS